MTHTRAVSQPGQYCRRRSDTADAAAAFDLILFYLLHSQQQTAEGTMLLLAWGAVTCYMLGAVLGAVLFWVLCWVLCFFWVCWVLCFFWVLCCAGCYAVCVPSLLKVGTFIYSCSISYDQLQLPASSQLQKVKGFSLFHTDIILLCGEL